MNWAQFKDSVSRLYLTGAVVASWSLTQEMVGLNPFTVITNIFVTELAELSELFRENSNVKNKFCSFNAQSPHNTVLAISTISNSDRFRSGLLFSAFVGVNYLMECTHIMANIRHLK